MKVKELIDKLSEMPDNYDVLTKKTEMFGNVGEVVCVRIDEYARFGVSIPCVLITDEWEHLEKEEVEAEMTREEAINILTSVLHTDGAYMDYLDSEDVKAIKFLASDERPHGEWIKGEPWTTGVGMGEQYGYYYACSKCGYKVKGGYTSCEINFCQYCGSDNRKREGEAE